MRPKTLIPAILLLAFAAPQHAFAKAHPHAAASKQSTDPNYKYIKAAYDYQNFGYVSRDCNRIFSYTTPDFVQYGVNGAVRDKAACIKAMYNLLSFLYQYETQLIAEIKSDDGVDVSDIVTRTVTIEKFAVKDGVAVVIETGRLHVNAQGVRGDQARSTEFHKIEGVYRDVWVRGPQGWLQKSTTQLY
ncbi:nuclear transport factor 2 family protein [Capsulimonas corticalis]|uniref:nuclear transport factor 2 family protein n=1 Tax=Capsulimonas corticalis TaxID=2219043 RepID=UPI00140200CB|nr:nuclear transport factor 2 family protein [Capsulimonas corticalis]